MKACFPIDIFGNPLCPVDSVKNLGVWFNSDFSLSKHVQNVCKSCFVKLCDFRHVRQFLMFLCLWLMLLLVVGWITETHFSGASPSSIYANYSAFKTVQPELYQFEFICCFTLRSTARVILRRVVYRWRKPVHTAL